MSGHSHWATIRRKKGAADAKKGQLFTRLTREIVLAARDGGGDPSANARLQLAIERARANNMPKENIERAIKRGTGELKEGGALEEIYYEGYAPNGIALLILAVTDNRNRAVAEIRHVLNRHGGSMAEAGSVAWQFKKSAYFSMPRAGVDAEKVFEVAVEAGASDVNIEDELIEVIGPVEAFNEISTALRQAGFHPEEAELRMIPNNEVELPPDETIQVLKVIEALEDLDDVQTVYSTLAISDEAMAQLEAA
ncbi:MAG: YebC/PmpR family DNA-binding transcriptional regulator [Anaerolineales bacterium]|nr:YebC/PmpR family DNA-binding transcriptional regulator [Anaerolineales bacterium]MCS7247023.1 YebC/PmpR family DNA-binding transcriptional regulator [Anaerolineales bacterium]MDW8160834.1 YebC/PmpR family DNA-binding transcriptional regulator [Anaerolineales bacterium]MDW8446810.1 YebC/PmpR family DNA-binding transcriptional regulator [Anaerolineales bacterium]